MTPVWAPSNAIRLLGFELCNFQFQDRDSFPESRREPKSGSAEYDAYELHLVVL